METKRQLQVAEVVKRNFSMVLFQEGTYIYGTEALVSVSKVKMSSDLGIAKIYLSIYNSEDKQSVLMQLEHHITRLRQVLATRIKRQVRRIPLLHFYIDDTLDEMYKLRNLFDKLDAENQLGHSEEE